MYGEDAPIPGVVPTIVGVPDEMLFDIANGRKYINKIKGSSWQSVETIKKALRAHHAEAKTSDASVCLDMEFLEEQYDELIENKVKSCLLECLPHGNEKRSIAKAVEAGRALATRDIAVAQKKTLQKVLNSAVNLLSDVYI